MIKTIDGLTLKRGDVGFIIGITLKGVYAPCRVIAHSTNPAYSIPDETKVYGKRDACQKACDERNKKHAS